MKREVIKRPPLVRVELDRETRERLRLILREIFGRVPSGKVTMNANDGGVLHIERMDDASTINTRGDEGRAVQRGAF